MLVYFRIANKYNIIDKPNNRSSHKQLTIRGGGIIFFLGVLIYTVLFGINYPFFIIGLSLISVISFLDDLYNISSKIRIFVHFVAMMLMFYDCGIYSLPWYYYVSALIVSIGIINAFNFMDGINGITGGYSIIVVGSFWWINNNTHSFIDNNLLYVTIISLFIFNIFNFRKNAMCFAGDVGSVSIAFIIVFLMGKLIIETGDLSFLIILILYGVDSILTIVHRLMLNENIFEAHRKHLYQIMTNELKIPHTKVSLIYMLTQAGIMIGYFYFKNVSWIYFIVTATILALIYILFMKKFFQLHTTNIANKL